MAFDGFAVSALVSQFNKEFLDGRIQKISQPENDEIMLSIKGVNGTSKVVLSANPTLPLCYITNISKISPALAPNFLMVLRKYLSGGKITKIYQSSLDRCINFEVEHYSEMGDKEKNILLIELMGKYSNIILINNENRIIDAIKHVGFNTSSVREVVPGKEYFLPNSGDKLDPLIETRDSLVSHIKKDHELSKALVNSFVGFSNQISSEIVKNLKIDERKTITDLEKLECENLKNSFFDYLSKIKNDNFKYFIYYKDNKPIEFSVFELETYKNFERKEFDNPSDLIFEYYNEKEAYTRIHQKSTDLRRVVTINYDRIKKKETLQLKQLKDCEKKDKYRVYGELIQAYSYEIPNNSKSVVLKNYYDNDNEITIPLDNKKTPTENANYYFKKYSKLKRTKDSLTEQIKITRNELYKLESIKTLLEFSKNVSDLNDIKNELIEYGYIKYSKNKKNKNIKKSEPIHYITKDNFHIYVGKNNVQNDYLSNIFATKEDMWFHTKKYHGSHVILKYDGRQFPDRLYEICASLAAHYSSGVNQNKVEVDYVKAKELKKVKGAALGYVIYHTNYSIVVKPKIDNNIKEV